MDSGYLNDWHNLRLFDYSTNYNNFYGFKNKL